MSELREVRLGDCTTWQSGGTPSKSNPEFWNGDIPWMSASSMSGNRFNDSSERVTKIGAKNGTRLAKTNDILLLVRGSGLHKRLPVGKAMRPVTFNQDVKALTPKSDIITTDYLLYWFLANEEKILGKVELTGIGAGKLDTLNMQNMLVPLPILSIQHQIAAILSAFDDKIELNRQMNRTLEQMARALFKSWFVDFEPVRAKLRGEQPEGMDAQTAALFPDELVEVDGREVPKGWEWGTVGDIATQAKDQITPLSEPEASFAHFSIPAFDAKNQPTIEQGSEIKSNKFIVPDRAILVSKLNPSTPRIWNVVRDETVDFNVCSTEFIPLVASQIAFDSLLNASLNDEAFSKTLAGQAFGTSNSHQRVKPADILDAPLLIPDSDLIKYFDALTAPIIEQVKENLRESAKLASLRDALLPRLLSGEVDVSEWSIDDRRTR